MRILFFHIVLVAPSLFFGQGETSNRSFGEEVGLKFKNEGSLNTPTDGGLNIFEGCATLSNTFGLLLFIGMGL